MSETFVKKEVNTEPNVSVEEYNSLKAELAELKEARVKDGQLSFIKDYCSHLDKEIIKGFQDGTTDYSATLENLLVDSKKQADDIAESFAKTTPKAAGSVSGDDLKDKAEFIPSSKTEAYDFVCKRDNIKGKDAMMVVAKEFPNLYGKGDK